MISIVSYPDRGIGGNNAYRGNCSPRLIEDIINQFHFSSISDYMVGGGTTRDVAVNKGIENHCYDLHSGFNLMTDEIKERNEGIFWHPPYWNMITYSDNMYSSMEVQKKYGYNPNEWDLSRCASWEDFVKKMNYCCLKQYSTLSKGGRMCILMGDLKRRGKLYSMLLDIVKPSMVENIIIKAQHNCMSNDKSYMNENFIRISHEYILIIKKDNPLIYNITYCSTIQNDIRDIKQATWRDVVASVLEDINHPIALKDIYKSIEGHKKSQQNSNWKAKVRQTLQIHPDIFYHNKYGVWSLKRCY